MEFFAALAQFEFLRNALVAGVLSSVACGAVGTLVVVRRIAVLAGGIAHCVLGGLGAARYLQVVHGIGWLDPMLGAVVAALTAAAVIGVVSLRSREREDTAIAAVWAVGMAVGILFISATPGSNPDLMTYLFGDILLVRTADLWLMAGLDAAIVAVVALLFPRIAAVCFDEEFARVRGLKVERYFVLLLALAALTVVVLVRVVGIILVIALLTLPVAVAERFTTTLGRLMVVSGTVCAALTTAGLILSYRPDLPAGPTTIILAGLVYLVVLVTRRRRP